MRSETSSCSILAICFCATSMPFISSSVELSGSGTAYASGGKPAGRSVSCSSERSRKRVTDFVEFTNIVFVAAGSSVYLSDGISYMYKNVPFSARYAKSAGFTEPHFANRSSSCVEEAILSSNDFFFSLSAIMSSHFARTCLLSATLLCAGILFFATFWSSSIERERSVFANASLNDARTGPRPSICSRWTTPSLRSFLSDSFLVSSRTTRETFFI